ncbi:hypothetical protein GCM10009715_28540 [Paeniglutamicibacter psychrophenolicus]|uniref:Endonuclease G n=1 Tax=Paeniglutamicibacter psychrophenolicus TaxID=257454 RepID=A0ABS4WGG5_9MICC|nr:DNA/RNA non-specific endonuclease [Paeniglutamicibacter psychrophenolicus]MBP2375283.1 endonuclease G [Paeniglutamicibacter psychrophenolicus]
MTDTTAPENQDSAARTGYDPDFLATHIEAPALDESIRDDAVLWEGAATVPYTHFSLTLSRSRRFARWVAWNIDGASIKRLSRANSNFTDDPRLPDDAQTGNELYANNRLDRGHLARRADLLWGDLPGAKQANKDSFYYTNITPQMDDFNQSSKEGIWGRLENAVFEEVDVDDLRVSVFGGPVFHEDDRIYRGTALPHEYWKLVAFFEGGVLKSRAFLLTQNLDQLRALMDLDEFRVYQITLVELEDRTMLHFPEALHAADAPTTATTRAAGERMPLDSAAGIQW